MKRYLYCLIALSILACSNSKPTIEPPVIEQEDILGEWHTENALINESPASDFLDGGEFYASILGLQKDDFYFLNYNSGTWSLDRNILTLSNKGKFEIIFHSDSLMTMKGDFLASELFIKLNGVSEDDTITLQEDYRRR